MQLMLNNNSSYRTVEMKEISIEKNAYLQTNSRARWSNVPASLVTIDLSLSRTNFTNPKSKFFYLNHHIEECLIIWDHDAWNSNVPDNEVIRPSSNI